MSEQDLIISSLDIAADKGVDITPLVYARYFQNCPESEQLMEDADPHARGKMLEEVMRLLMLEDILAEESYLVFETKTHEQSYHVMRHMYASLLNAVLEVVKGEVGKDWNEAFEQAWRGRVTSLLKAIENHSPCHGG
jgi:hemoglobin-like flavoprotein